MASVHPLAGGERGMELRLEEVEVALLISLAGQLIEFVSPTPVADADPLVALVGIDPDAVTPDDPALRRLLPDAYRDDEEAAAEFRRFTERDLREGKARNARLVLDQLSPRPRSIEIAGDAIPAWLGFLNDTRLTLGARIEITEDNHEELYALPDDDPRAALVGVYDWLTFVQESLVQSLLPNS